MDERRRVDREVGELDPVGFDEFMMLAGQLIDRDFEADGAELAGLVADLERHPPWSVAEPGNLDRYRCALAADREPVPVRVDGRRVEPVEPLVEVPAEHDIEIGRRPRADPEPQLHRRAAFDDEQVTTIVVADLAEHRAHDPDAHEVHDALGELTDLAGVSLQEPLELACPTRAAGHLDDPCSVSAR